MLVRQMFSPKIAPFPSGIITPTYHTVPRAKPTHHLKRHLDQFSRFYMGPKCYAVQCIINKKENPQNGNPRWDFVTLLEQDLPTAIGNIHKKIGRDQTCCSGDILEDRQT